MDKESLLVRATPIVQRMATELIALTPEHWVSFFVNVEVVSKPADLEDLKLVIRCDEWDDIVFPSDELDSCISELFALFKDFFRVKEFTCRVFQKGDGGWSYETEFDFFEGGSVVAQ